MMIVMRRTPNYATELYRGFGSIEKIILKQNREKKKWMAERSVKESIILRRINGRSNEGSNLERNIR